MTRPFRKTLLLALALALAPATASLAQSGNDVFAEYRAMFGDDNPAELAEMQGEEIWRAVQGPKQVSLEQCDLGLGPGVTEGAYARLPRWFEDAGQVMDLEMRLLWCKEKQQGLDVSALRARPFSEQGQQQTDLEALSAYLASQSRGATVAVPQDHPAERRAFENGKRFFNYRAGPHDFSCATCHTHDGKRIRLQDMPRLNTTEGARGSFPSWPAYRLSQGAVRTLEWRMNDCMRQQRLPGLVHGSDVAIGLMTYLGVQANGAEMDSPGLKR